MFVKVSVIVSVLEAQGRTMINPKCFQCSIVKICSLTLKGNYCSVEKEILSAGFFLPWGTNYMTENNHSCTGHVMQQGVDY